MEMNLSAAELLGVDRSLGIRKPLVRFARLQDRRKVLEHIRRSRSEERIVTELVLVSRDGRQFPAEIASRREPSGRLRAVVLDVTERHKAEAARKQADEERRQAILREQAARASAEAKDRFIAMISHELRTPLTPILATVSQLELAPDGWDLRAALSRIRRNVELEARLIDVAASHRAGFAEHLTKPVDVRALLGAIERARKTSGGAAS